MKKLFIILTVVCITLLIIKRKEMTWRQSLLKTVYPLIMLKEKWFPGDRSVQLNSKKVQAPVSFYTLHATANNGADIDFGAFTGKKVLIVNTASDCGFTAQYDELETLHQRFKDKLIILGFPANDFKQQEKKDDAAIAAFCKINYGVSFPLMQKSHVVRGVEQNPVFEWLTDAGRNGWCTQAPIWNFSKYLVDEHGVLIGYFVPTVSPMNKKIVLAIE